MLIFFCVFVWDEGVLDNNDIISNPFLSSTWRHRKTIQVISLIAHLRTRNVSGPFIVVAPLATLPNWIREFQKWLPSLPVIRFHGTAKERDAMLEGPLNKSKRKNADYPVVVTSYEVAIRDEKRLNKIGEFTYLVVDEGIILV